MNRNDPVECVLRSKGGEVYTVPPSTTVLDALEVMAERGVGALIVTDDRRIAGVISERDYARKVILQGRSSRDTTVSEIMTSDPTTVSPRETVDECMRLMTGLRVRHLPVVEGGTLTGIVSMGDLVKWVISAQQEEIEHLHAYISGGYTQ